MKRLQLFEVLDQRWCPQVIRHGATDFLETITSRADIYRTVIDKFFNGIAVCGSDRVVDLCSGGGGPWLSQRWTAALAAHAPAPAHGHLTVALTDKFPSLVLAERLASQPQISAILSSVDATSVPASLRGFRTIFSSFHHFPDPMAHAVLSDAVHCGDGFATAEVSTRTVRAFATILLLPLLVWLLTPTMRPFRWSRLLFTYLLPLIPLVILWDGLVSCCRTRTPEELLNLAAAFPQYNWEAGYAKGSWLPPVYLIGLPKLNPTPKT